MYGMVLAPPLSSVPAYLSMYALVIRSRASHSSSPVMSLPCDGKGGSRRGEGLTMCACVNAVAGGMPKAVHHERCGLCSSSPRPPPPPIPSRLTDLGSLYVPVSHGPVLTLLGEGGCTCQAGRQVVAGRRHASVGLVSLCWTCFGRQEPPPPVTLRRVALQPAGLKRWA